MAKGNHAPDEKPGEGHHRTGTTSGGKCVWRHVSRVTRSSCSHRWQAWKQAAGENRGWYDGYGQRASEFFDPPPPPGSWDVPRDDGAFPKLSRNPYRHQAHHIVPRGVLWDCIYKAAKGDKGSELVQAIQTGLCHAEYNLNHMINMIILPMGRQTSLVLQLPAHLEKGERKHKDYSNAVEERVQEVINEYKQTMEAGLKEDHPGPPEHLARGMLEEISRDFRDAIRSYGVQQSNLPKNRNLVLNRIPKEHFRNA